MDRMDPNSFKGKILFSAIDKIIIGGIAVIVLLPIQYLDHKYKQLLEERLSVSKVLTGILVKQRNDLTECMGKYFLLLDQIRSQGKPNPSQVDQLAQIKYDINLIIFTLSPINKKIGESAQPLIDSINYTNRELPRINHIPQEIDKFAKQTQITYMAFLDTLREITKDTVKQEFKSVKFEIF
jgi:hypothetical protein